MLQQTRVAAVIPYYERFLARFPDVRVTCAKRRKKKCCGCGPDSATTAARAICKRPRSRSWRYMAENFRKTEEDAFALSGIGPYTGAAILSIAFGEKLAVLDGNVARVLARLGAVRGDLREIAALAIAAKNRQASCSTATRQETGIRP